MRFSCHPLLCLAFITVLNWNFTAAQEFNRESGFIVKANKRGSSLVFYPIIEQIERLKSPALVSGAVRGAYYVKEVELLSRYPGVQRGRGLDYTELVRRQVGLQPFTSLVAAFCPIDNKFVDAISQTQLEAVDVGGTQLTSDSLVRLLKLPRLVSLFIYDTPADNAFLEKLLECESIRCLSVGGTKMSLNHVSQVMPKCHLEELFAHSLQVEPRAFRMASTTIRRLDLSFNDLGDCRFGDFDELEELFLIGSTLNQELVNDIARLPKLKRLFIYESDIDRLNLNTLKSSDIQLFREPNAAFSTQFAPPDFLPSDVYSKK